MNDYVEPYPTFDRILELLMANPHHRLEESYIYNQFDSETRPGVRSAIVSLEAEQCIRKDSPDGNWLILSAKGSSVYNSGGYRANLERQRIADEFKKQLDAATLSMTKSVEETNKAVQKNFQYQRKFGNLSLILGAFSSLFIFITILQKCGENTERRLQDIQTEFQKSKLSLDSIRFSIGKVDSSMKNITTDTILVKRRH